MTPEELKTKLTSLLPSAVFEDGNQWVTLLVEPQNWKDLAEKLRDDVELRLDYLFCLTCVDWKTHMTMVYHLESTHFRHTIVVKSKLDRLNPQIESVSATWRTAEFHEREVYELFGVNFLNHPDLRLLILPDGWEGKNPLRKDFEDPVNMICL